MERSVEPPGHFLKRHVVTIKNFSICTNITATFQLEGKFLLFVNLAVFSTTPYMT